MKKRLYETFKDHLEITEDESDFAVDEAYTALELFDTRLENMGKEILEEMESEPKSEVRELLEFDEDTAGGMMNTQYIALHENARVDDALAALRGNEDLHENLNTLFLIDDEGRLKGAVPLARLFVASGSAALKFTSSCR